MVTNFIGGTLFVCVGDGTKAQERITMDPTSLNPIDPILHTPFALIGTTAAFHTPFAQTGTNTERWAESECQA